MIVFRVHCKSGRRNDSILILPFHGFFHVWHGSVRENLPPWGTLKLVILPNFKVTCLKRAKLDTAPKNLRTSHLHPTTIQRFVNFHNFADLYIPSLVFNKSLSNLAVLLILRRSYQRGGRIFPNLSMSKVKKKKKPWKGLLWLIAVSSSLKKP